MLKLQHLDRAIAHFALLERATDRHRLSPPLKESTMHYKDGTEAKVGDLVKGTTYNHKGVVVGVMLGITPGSAACNCRVAIVQQRGIGKLDIPMGDAAGTPHLHEVRTHDGAFIVHRENTGMRDGKLYQGDVSLVGVKIDYSQCDHLELVHRPEAE